MTYFFLNKHNCEWLTYVSYTTMTIAALPFWLPHIQSTEYIVLMALQNWIIPWLFFDDLQTEKDGIMPSLCLCHHPREKIEAVYSGASFYIRLMNPKLYSHLNVMRSVFICPSVIHAFASVSIISIFKQYNASSLLSITQNRVRINLSSKNLWSWTREKSFAKSGPYDCFLGGIFQLSMHLWLTPQRYAAG